MNSNPDQTIVITGGSRGIGKSIAKLFLSHGWQVGICGRSPKNVSNALDELSAMYPNSNIWGEAVELSQIDHAMTFAKNALQKFKTIDVWVNNAGKYTPGKVSEPTLHDDLMGMISLNLMSAYWCGKVIVPAMKDRGSGCIINMSSIAGLQAYPGGGSYAISKFALTGYTRTLRQELMTHNIKVVGIYPGATLTDSWLGTELPQSRFIQPEDIAQIIYQITQLSPSAVVEDIIIRPQLGDI